MATNKNITSWDEVPVIIDLPYACRLLGKSYEGMKKLCQQNKVPAFKVGKEWRMRKEDLEQFIENQTAKSNAVEFRIVS